MLKSEVFSCCVVIFILLVSQSSCDLALKSSEALSITLDTTLSFYNMYMQCINAGMPNKKFATDDLKSFVNYPSKTTVGFAPKFTSNRRFFANMISTPDFKNSLARDEEDLRQDMIRKMKYCDSVVMDQNLLRDMYDREVDQSKI